MNNQAPNHSLIEEPEQINFTEPKSKQRIEDWLQNHHWLIALIIIAIGFIIRLLAASFGYLNPDEVYNILTANQSSLIDVYRESMNMNPHPPLYYLLLYFWRLFGSSDFYLRLPSVIGGTLALWFAFKWLSITFNAIAGLIGLILLSFATEVVALSAEVRDYAVLLFLIFSSLYLLERGLKEKSPLIIAFFSITLPLSIFTNYSAIWFAIVLGIYMLWQVIRGQVSGKVKMVWFIGQIFTVSLCIFLYITCLSKLKGSALESYCKEGWLRDSYFNPGHESIILFPLKNTFLVFRYLFSSSVVGIIVLLLFLAGIIILLVKGLSLEQSQPKRRILGFLLLLPFIITCASAINGFYPYGGTRHSLFLIAFAIAGVSYFLSRVLGKRIWFVLLGAIILMPIWKIVSLPPSQHINPQDQRRELMTSAMDYLQQILPSNGILFSDIQTQQILRWYFCKGEPTPYKSAPPGFTEIAWRGFHFVRKETWYIPADSFGFDFRRMAEAYHLKCGERVYVAAAGWGANLALGLYHLFGVTYPGLQTFGRGISIFTVPVVGDALDSLAVATASLKRLNVKSVFWPTHYFTDSTHNLTDPLSNQILTYTQLYDKLISGESDFNEYLPSIAFWIFDSPERHPEFMRYMNDSENYITEDYRFTLIYVNLQSVACVYLIELIDQNQ